MSVTDSAVPNREYDLSSVNAASMLSLNELFKESMKKVQSRTGQANVIFRCEQLPLIQGDREGLIRVFDALTNAIMSALPADSKLFLYVDCAEDRSDEEGQEGKRYQIRFHTNITTSDQWRALNQSSFALCQRILSDHNATFVVNNINNTGCLFSITVPGKFQ